MSSGAPRLDELLPGLAALALLAALARWIAGAVPRVNALALAVGLGVLLGNLAGVPETLQPGVDRHKLLLETGIVLLGASIPLDRIVASGGLVLLLVLATVAVGVGLVELLSRTVAGLPARTGSLLAAGASICGVSAVVAVARSIDADRDTLAYVAGAVLLFDAITLVAFPVAGAFLGLPEQQFGVWVGLSMFSTGPVAAAGFAHSAAAGRWATITKLVRNAFIGVLAVGYALAYVDRDGGTRPGPRGVWEQFPKFLVGFLLVVAAANAGLLSAAGLRAVEAAADWLFAIAFVGVGASIRLGKMRAAGVAPAAVLAAHLLVVSALALAAVTLAL